MLVGNNCISMRFAAEKGKQQSKIQKGKGKELTSNTDSDSDSFSLQQVELKSYYPIDHGNKDWLITNSNRISRELEEFSTPSPKSSVLPPPKPKSPVLPPPKPNPPLLLEDGWLVNPNDTSKQAKLSRACEAFHKLVINNPRREVSPNNLSREEKARFKVSYALIAKEYNNALNAIGDETIHSRVVKNSSLREPYSYYFKLMV
jgi:hypothetical protein